MTNPAVVGQGFELVAGAPPLMLNIRDHGDMVTRQWFGIITVGADDVTIFEALTPSVESEVMDG